MYYTEGAKVRASAVQSIEALAPTQEQPYRCTHIRSRMKLAIGPEIDHLNVM